MPRLQTGARGPNDSGPGTHPRARGRAPGASGSRAGPAPGGRGEGAGGCVPDPGRGAQRDGVSPRRVTRRLVVDLAAVRPVWRIPSAQVAAIAALLPGWDVIPVDAPANSDGDGGGGSPAAVAAATGAEIYLGFGVPKGIQDAARAT